MAVNELKNKKETSSNSTAVKSTDNKTQVYNYIYSGTSVRRTHLDHENRALYRDVVSSIKCPL